MKASIRINQPKTILAVLLSVLIIIFSAFSFCFLPITLSAENTDGQSNDLLSPAAMEQTVKTFLNVSKAYPNGNRGGRTPFSESEALMADAIAKHASSFQNAQGEQSYSVSKKTFNVNVSATEGEKTSQNVIVSKPAKDKSAKQVIFIASYDSLIESTSSASRGIFSLLSPADEDVVYETGAMDNATGCGVLYGLLDYYKDIDLNINLKFVFAGANHYYYSGSNAYLTSLTKAEKDNTLIVFSYERLGGDTLYMYNEEVQTKHGEFLLGLNNKVETLVVKAPKNLPIINAIVVDRIPYAHYAMIGSAAPFMQEYIPIASFFSAYYSVLGVSDLEGRGQAKRSGSIDDTFVFLESDFPQYKNQMSSVAKLTVNAVKDASFEDVLIQSRTEYNNYDAYTKKAIVQFVVLGLCILIVAVAYFVSKHLDKKYPMEAEKKVVAKIAVFGKDYETDEHVVELEPMESLIKALKDKDDPFS